MKYRGRIAARNRAVREIMPGKIPRAGGYAGPGFPITFSTQSGESTGFSGMRKIIYGSKYYYVMGHKTGRHRGIADARACARAHRYSGRTAMPGDPMLKSCPQKNRWQGVRDPLPHVCLRCSGPPFSGTGYRIPCRCGNGFARFCSCVSRNFPGIRIGAGKRSRCRHPGRFFLLPWDKTGSRFHPFTELPSVAFSDIVSAFRPATGGWLSGSSRENHSGRFAGYSLMRWNMKWRIGGCQGSGIPCVQEPRVIRLLPDSTSRQVTHLITLPLKRGSVRNVWCFSRFAVHYRPVVMKKKPGNGYRSLVGSRS